MNIEDSSLIINQTQVGTKVAAVSRKTNTTTHEILGVMTKGNTQIVCIIPSHFLWYQKANSIYVFVLLSYC